MYESPIKVFQNNLEMQLEGEILNTVQRMNITVDKDELIRALRYDREQYQKGFDDARKNAVLVVRCKDCKYFGLNDENVPYCFNRFGLDDPEPNGFCNYGIGKI